MESTRERLLNAGIQLFAVKGFNHTGIAEILQSTNVPKGSFYHYFKSKEDLGLAVIDSYGQYLLDGLNSVLSVSSGSSLSRLRAYFEAAIAYFEADISLSRCNCLLGNLGQELALQSDSMRLAVLKYYLRIEARFSECLVLAQQEGELARSVDTVQLARLLFSSWEGALVRARLEQSARPLRDLLVLFFDGVFQQVE